MPVTTRSRSIATIPSTVAGNLDGGPGNDTVKGHGTLDGGSGNDADRLPLADTLRGEQRPRPLDAGNGPDDIAGGSGTDSLTYPATAPRRSTSRSAPETATTAASRIRAPAGATRSTATSRS